MSKKFSGQEEKLTRMMAETLESNYHDISLLRVASAGITFLYSLLSPYLNFITTMICPFLWHLWCQKENFEPRVMERNRNIPIH